MSYTNKTTSANLNTRLTDVGRKKLSQGNFNIKYFQVGDSEISYLSGITYNYAQNMILEPAFNEHNSVGSPQSNKQSIKYPFYLQGTSGNTYGIPFMTSKSESVYNTTEERGFFTGGSPTFSAKKTTGFTKNANYIFELDSLSGGNKIDIIQDVCSTPSFSLSAGDFITIFYTNNASCGEIDNVYPILTYKISEICDPDTLQLDRDLPDLSCFNLCSSGRTFVYPQGMTSYYDTVTPSVNWDFVCDDYDVNIWNMNIPWSETPAGIDNSLETFDKFGSVTYLGTKEYLGYGSSQSKISTDDVYYYDSLGDEIIVQPKDQKAIAIIHYSNNSVDNVYGEKFALEPYDPSAIDPTGQAANFKVKIPWIMWHKSPTKTMGLTLYVNPPSTINTPPQVKYVQSTKNPDMNTPGIRYFDLWDDYGNRVGKVFPDSRLIVIDDEEIVAALSYKSNRNWTLPAPKVSLVTPNVCDANAGSQTGLLTGNTEFLYVTYRFTSDCFTNSLHCNYYQKVQGPNSNCNQLSQNVSVQFGEEFTFLTQKDDTITCCPDTINGYLAKRFVVLAQKVNSDMRPDPSQWREIDFTDSISSTTLYNCLTESGLTQNTFVITKDLYDNAPPYDLSDYITLPSSSEQNKLGFGDEYYFYGNIETDIQATIYEMVYTVNLRNNEFKKSSNPTWNENITEPFVSEVGLYDEDKNLLVMTKFRSPFKRLGINQINVKLDF